MANTESTSTPEALENFTTSLRELYSDRLIGRERQWPPCKSGKLVKLQIVESNKGDSRKPGHGQSVKEARRTPIEYHNLFKSDGRKSVRKILALGDPGIGKTTLSIALTEGWSQGELLQQFKMVILLPLREREVASAKSLEDLLSLLHSCPEVCAKVVSHLKTENGRETLFVADGWDEAGSQQSEDSMFYQLLSGHLLPLASVLLTSRPSAATSLLKLPSIDLQVEIVGFADDDIKQYVKSELADHPHKMAQLLSELDNNPVVNSMCAIPLNCAIICHIWKEEQKKIPHTMTQLYTIIILHIASRELNKQFHTLTPLECYEDIPSELQPQWQALCKLAYDGIESGQLVFSKKELECSTLAASFLDFGLLQSRQNLFGSHVSFHFIHLTFQEMLAALHLRSLTSEQQVEVSKKHKFIKSRQFRMVWRFFFGLSKYKDIPISLPATVSMDSYGFVNHQQLCHLAFENGSKSFSTHIADLLKGNFRNLHLSSVDCQAMAVVMQESEEHYPMEVQCGVKNTGLAALVRPLVQAKGKLQVKKLDLTCSSSTSGRLLFQASCAFKDLTDLTLSLGGTLGDKGVALLSLMLQEPLSLQKLVLIDLGMTEASSPQLIESLKKHTSLSYIVLNKIGVAGIRALTNLITDNTFPNIHSLRLSQACPACVPPHESGLDDLLDSLTHCPQLRKLNLSQNPLGVPGAGALGRLLSQVKKMEVVSVNEAMIGDEGLLEFSRNLTRQCSVECLQMAHNGIHGEGLSHLATAVCSGLLCLEFESIFKRFNTGTLDLTQNPLGPDGPDSLILILQSPGFQVRDLKLSECSLGSAGAVALLHSIALNKHLFKVDLSSNNIGEHWKDELQSSARSVTKHLSSSIPNSTLSAINFDGNKFTGIGVRLLAHFLSIFQSLHELTTRHCGLTSEDLQQLFKELRESDSSSQPLSRLAWWYLENNHIDDEGALVLLQQLPLLPVLKLLNLSGNPLSPEVVQQLYSALSQRGGHVYFWYGPQERSSGDESDLSPPTAATEQAAGGGGRGSGVEERIGPETETTIPAAGDTEGDLRSESESQSLSGERGGPTEQGTPLNQRVLGEDDLPVLSKILHDAAYKWKEIGLQLGLGSKLANIEHSPLLIPRGPPAFLCEILTVWLRRASPQPTLLALTEALRSPTVGEESLANELEEEYAEPKAKGRGGRESGVEERIGPKTASGDTETNPQGETKSQNCEDEPAKEKAETAVQPFVTNKAAGRVSLAQRIAQAISKKWFIVGALAFALLAIAFMLPSLKQIGGYQ